jgi:cytochrome c oxidase assembly protein subunit 15
VLTLAVIIFQALLGMWTVTWLLKPIVVMGHLLGGLTTFSLLVWMAWRATDRPITLAEARRAAALAVIGGRGAAGHPDRAGRLGQRQLRGVCACGSWWISRSAWASGGRRGLPRRLRAVARASAWTTKGGVLDGASRIAIQLAHRIVTMAVVVALYVLALALRLFRTPGMRGLGADAGRADRSRRSRWASSTSSSTLPLPVAVAHNAGAVLLLFTMVSLLARLRRPD